MAEVTHDHTDSVRAPHAGGLRHYIVACLLCIGFVLLVEHFFGWARLLAPWDSLDFRQVTVAIALILFSYVIRTFRLFSYFRMHGTRNFTLCLKVMLQHNLLNNLLPMRTGEASFPLLLHRHFSTPLVRSLPALLWFRLLDLHTLVNLGLIALGSDYLPGAAIWLLLAGWNALPCIVYRGTRRLDRKLKSTSEENTGLTSRMLAALPGNASALWISWWWTVLNWLVKLGAFAWTLQFFIEVSLRTALLGAIGGDLTSVLPIHSVAGMGTYEGGVVAALLPFGITVDQALTGAVNLHLVLLAATLISGVLSLFIRGRGT